MTFFAVARTLMIIAVLREQIQTVAVRACPGLRGASKVHDLGESMQPDSIRGKVAIYLSPFHLPGFVLCVFAFKYS